MKIAKKALLVGAGVATVGLASLTGAGIVSAATGSTASTSGSTSLVDKIAQKFNLNKSDVQAVFDEDRQSHITEMKTKRAEALKTAVSDGKLTQAQADHITAAWKEIDDLRGTSTNPQDESATVRSQIKDKMDALHEWAKQQNLDLPSILGMGGPGMGVGHMGPRDADGNRM